MENYFEQRDNHPQYLKTVIGQREIVIEERQRQISEQATQINKLNQTIKQLEGELVKEKQRAEKQINNLDIALKDNQAINQQIKHEKSQLEFKLNLMKIKDQQRQKEHMKEVNKLKNDYEAQKDSLNTKINKLQKNLQTLHTHYQVEDGINEDKHKIIEDANRNLRGFANQNQQRMIIIQNQQLTNQIQFQSRQISQYLDRNQKLQQEIKQYKMDLQLHKNIENDLVKRSSLAQNLIKQLNTRVRELQHNLKKQTSASQAPKANVMDYSEGSRVSSVPQSNKQIQAQFAKLKFQNATLKNYNHYLETNQKVAFNRYQTLGEIMAQYLETVLFVNKTGNQNALELEQNLTIDLNALKEKDIKQWKPEETEIILQLLIEQIKPYISKSSLTTFPQVRNIKVSFIQEQSKEAVSLPKIVEEIEKAQERQAKKSNRFKDIPVDISTKILRSNLREWGGKVSFGQNIPKNRKVKSKSIMPEIDRSFI